MSTETPPAVTYLPASPDGIPAPLIKIPGSKRWLVPAVAESISAHLKITGGKLLEPFAGSAAIALGVGANGHALFVSDLNRDLMLTLTAARDCPDALFDKLDAAIKAGVDRATYYKVRTATPDDPLGIAARALYLSRLGFNGLWRVNAKGEFNAPYGTSPTGTRSFPSRELIRQVGGTLSKATISKADYTVAFAEAKEGDAIYGDPPYLGTFTGYASQKWQARDAAHLARLCREAAARGIAVIVSSPASPEIAEGYTEWAHSRTVPRRHIVAAKAADRVDYHEAIYTNLPQLVDVSKLPATPPVDADDDVALPDATSDNGRVTEVSP